MRVAIIYDIIEFVRFFYTEKGTVMKKSKIDAVVLRETAFVTAWVLILSAVMEAVFLICGAWDSRVILGNLLGAVGAVLYFFFMGLTVQKAVKLDSSDPTAVADTLNSDGEDTDEGQPEGLHKDARKLMALSQTLRMLMLVVIAVIGAVFECFNLIAVLIPYFFPRIAVMLRPFFMKERNGKVNGGEVN